MLPADYNAASGNIQLVGGPIDINYYGSGDPYPGWKNGQWSHVVATWCDRCLRMYINGKSCGVAVTDDKPLLRRVPETFLISAPTTALSTKSTF